jgi:hypothetical protein
MAKAAAYPLWFGGFGFKNKYGQEGYKGLKAF